MTESIGTQELEITVKLHVRVKAAAVNCDLRPWLAEDLISAINDAIWEDMPYSESSREDTDLVQEVLAVDIEQLTQETPVV